MCAFNPAAVGCCNVAEEHTDNNSIARIANGVAIHSLLWALCFMLGFLFSIIRYAIIFTSVKGHPSQVIILISGVNILYICSANISLIASKADIAYL